MCFWCVCCLVLCHFLRDLLRSAIRSRRDCGSGEFVYVRVSVVVCFCCALEMEWMRLRTGE